MVEPYDCLTLLASWLDNSAIVVTSRGPGARELGFLRPQGANFHSLNMGLCVPFALGLSLARPQQRIIAIDSDGSLLLDISSLVTVGVARPANFTLIVFDNQSYADMGPTATAGAADLEKMADRAHFITTDTIRSRSKFQTSVKKALENPGPSCFIVKTKPGKARVTVHARRIHGRSMKEAFIDAIRQYS